jgi:aspartyl-tRNA(Asn)/glutamyl-tRNA(Gln) amidotransferase subunit B
VANWILGELFRLIREQARDITDCRVQPAQLAALLCLVQEGAINATVGKNVLEEMFDSGQEAAAIVARRGLAQISDGDALVPVVVRVLAANPKPVQQYLEGKEAVLGYLVGLVMRETRGQANASIVGPLLREQLEKQRQR